MALIKVAGICGEKVLLNTDGIEIAYGIKNCGKDCTYVKLKTGKTVLLDMTVEAFDDFVKLNDKKIEKDKQEEKKKTAATLLQILEHTKEDLRYM